jgi:uncharacterized protein YdbL (DUF1318 family)
MLSRSIRFRSVLAFSLSAALLAGPAQAQRDPAYAAARAGGDVGEKTDGYLGVVGAGSADVRHMVDDINIKRKAVYAQQAQVQHATVEEYAFTAGCLAIGRTVPGEKYQTPDGTWTTRTSAAPLRDARCP